jgi:hypothetical protein
MFSSGGRASLTNVRSYPAAKIKGRERNQRLCWPPGILYYPGEKSRSYFDIKT